MFITHFCVGQKGIQAEKNFLKQEVMTVITSKLSTNSSLNDIMAQRGMGFCHNLRDFC